MIAGHRGPLLVQDVVFTDEMAHFDRERIPERVVHAKGAGESFVLFFNRSFHNIQVKIISQNTGRPLMEMPNLCFWEKVQMSINRGTSN